MRGTSPYNTRVYHRPFQQGSCRGGEIITVERKSEGDDEGVR